MMKRNFILSLVLIVLASVSLAAPKRGALQEAYIEKYAQIAVDEMFRSGVPASITLAQGMLESSYGQSELAVKGNNHFGIKCHDWKGPRMFYDDDRRGECFRKYKSPELSFQDHSDFLRYRDRYKFLFDLKITDYKGWAYGLKRAGYATDPKYPHKLIDLIETYDLSRFDQTDLRQIKKDKKARRISKREARRIAAGLAAAGQAVSEVKEAVSSSSGSSQEAASQENFETEVLDNVNVAYGSKVPESPNTLEEARPLEGHQRAEFKFSLSRQLYSHNGVAFVYSVEGETYMSISRQYDLFIREILAFNDASSAYEPLLPGTIVYVQPKKKQAAAHLDKYIAEGNESLRDISQRFAVKLKSLMKINGFDEGHQLKPGDTVMLRKKNWLISE